MLRRIKNRGLAYISFVNLYSQADVCPVMLRAEIIGFSKDSKADFVDHDNLLARFIFIDQWGSQALLHQCFDVVFP